MSINHAPAMRPVATSGASGRAGRHSRLPEVHRGWALMVVAGLIAAVGNIAVLGADDPGVAVVVVDGDHGPGTPVAELRTRVVTMPITDPTSYRLVTPDRLGTSLGQMVTAARLDDGELLRMGDLRPPQVQRRSAMSLPLSVGRAVAGTIARGDVVDVLGPEGQGVSVVAGSVEVLDVLHPQALAGGGLYAGDEYIVTLAVDDEQALALAVALRAGDIDVVRRPAFGAADG